MKTSKWLRALLVGALVVLLLAGGLAALLASQVDRAAVTARAVAEVQAATGRDFAIDGAVRLQFFPVLALVANDVRLGNAPWGSQPDMLQAKRLALNVALRPLLSRRVEVERVELSGASLLLETNAEGEGNWRFRRAGPAPATPDPNRKIHVTVARLLATDSTIAYRSGRSHITQSLAIESLTLGPASGDAAAVRAGDDFDQLDLAASYRGQALQVHGRMGALRTVASVASLPVDLAVTTDGTSASLKGELGLQDRAGRAQLALAGRVEQPAALQKLIGAALPAVLPLPATVKAKLSWDKRQLRADAIEWNAPGAVLGGRLDWDRAANPPALHLVARADGLDLARLRSAPAAPGSAQTGRLFPDTPLPRISPTTMALSGEWSVERLVLPGGIELGAVRAKASMTGDRIDVSSLTFGLARGTVTASGTLRGAPGEASTVTAHVAARNLAMDSLIALSRRKAMLSGGRTTIDADLSGSGRTVHQLAASVDGEVRLRMGPATAPSQTSAPQDLLAAFMRALTPNHAPSETIRISCAAARLPLRNGSIVVDRSIAVETDKLSLVMAGRIDLGSETLELAIRPTVRKGVGLKPGNFADVVKIGGTLLHPAVQVDVLGTAREAVSLSAAVASSGATLLAERLLRQNANPHPCQAALSGHPEDATDHKGKPGHTFKPLAPLRELFGR